MRRIESLAVAAAMGACAWLGIVVIGPGINASASAPTSTPTVFRMHRPGLRVRLEVRENKIFPTRVWVLRKCSSGFEGSGGLFLEEPGQEIPIRRDGRFEYEFRGNGELWGRTRMGGRVSQTKITGFFLDWSFEDRDLCGTGRPGKRALHFVAR